MDITQLAPSLLQLPFVVAFIWFALRMSNEYREDAKRRDEHWMQFLELERKQRKEAMDQGMQEVSAMTQGMRDMTCALIKLVEEMSRHDAAAMERHNTLKEAIDRK